MNRTVVIALLALTLASGTTLAQDVLLNEIPPLAHEEGLEPLHYTYVSPGDNSLMIEATLKHYSNGANISYSLSFPGRPDVVTCAEVVEGRDGRRRRPHQQRLPALLEGPQQQLGERCLGHVDRDLPLAVL